MSGDIYAAGALAYVPQTAWIPNDTVRNNIMFGKPYDEKKYEEVLTVCRLRRDLEVREKEKAGGAGGKAQGACVYQALKACGFSGNSFPYSCFLVGIYVFSSWYLWGQQELEVSC